MNNVYLDLLFLINFFTDYITLLCTAKLSQVEIRRKNIALASFLGGLYACLCMFYPSQWINTSIAHILCALLLCYISFYSEAQLFRCSIIFIIISAIFGGLLSPFVFPTEYGNQLFLNTKVLVITFSIVYALLSYLLNHKFKQFSQQYCQVEIMLLDRSITCKVLKDTGNELYEPISNLPVLILEQDIFKHLIPEYPVQVQTDDIYDTFCRLNSITHLCGKFRLIPFQTLSGKDILIGILPDKLYINGKEQKMIIAYTNKKLSKNNQYQGIY